MSWEEAWADPPVRSGPGIVPPGAARLTRKATEMRKGLNRARATSAGGTAGRPHPARGARPGESASSPVCSVSRRSSIRKSVPGEPRGVSWHLEIKHTVKQPVCQRGRLKGERETAKYGENRPVRVCGSGSGRGGRRLVYNPVSRPWKKKGTGSPK